uniref:Kinesin-like protein n=1 Tax=Ditylenchus dipsaci TaxID=166011 RepID=A0A915D946_9BILA
MAATTNKCTVRVAVRIRPQTVNQSQDDLDACTTVALSQSQIAVGVDKYFTFDHVFDERTGQEEVFERCVKQLVEGTFDGYNATILAYGQTGSGKTAAEHIFHGIVKRKAEAKEDNKVEPIFEVVVQFIELYNEEIIDLLTSGKSPAPIRIVEDLVKAEISLNGATKLPVRSIDEMLRILHRGAQHRTTMATNMNQTSSRSHAIFSVFVKQTRELENDADVVELCSQDTGVEFLSSKLHFVDLAGSERLKKTGATGDRAKESISINSGLLALETNSKLTRLLQDSLGGNSRTLMIACVSSSLTDHAETLNTLQYANRAKNISNKVVANQARKHRGREW